MRAEYLYWSIIIFSVIILVLVTCMVTILLNKKSTLKKRAAIVQQLEEWIMDIILENSGEAGYLFSIPSHIRPLLENKLARKVLVRELTKAKKSLSGSSGENLEKIYNQLNLHEISMRRLDNKHWHIKAKGIQELAIMNQHAYIEKILAHTNHADPMVRMEAQTAMVRLKGYDGLQFFDSLSYPLSEWHQVNLLSLLANQPIIANEGIYHWLNSSNDSVVQFSLKLISEQHASEFHDDVIKSLNHTNQSVRREAILCLGQMPSGNAAAELTTRFATEPDKNIRICIINEFRNTGSDIDLPFLENLRHQCDLDIKLAANKTVLYLEKNFNSL
jgi:hypothetical protein